MRRLLLSLVLFAAPVACPFAAAQMGQMQMHHAPANCSDATLRCAMVATPTFAPDGSLWVAWEAAGQVMVARSSDLGHSFAPAAAVTPAPTTLDTGPDSRPQIVVDRSGRVVVAYAIFKDKAYNGQILVARSTDDGASFSAPKSLTDDASSQRFDALALDADGRLFAAWLDKRDVVAAKRAGKNYVGAGLAFAWSNDGGATFAAARIAQDNTCECCRLGLAFAGPGRPVVLFRNVFGGTVRDHAVMTFDSPSTPGPVYRVSVDDWRIDACPHHGPSLAISARGTYHAAWFTDGRVRQGLFYARSTDGGRHFSAPIAIGDSQHQLSRPQVLAVPGALWVAWKEFDGERTSIPVEVSRDDGATWSAPEVVARTADASDHPLLVSDGRRAYLSWQTEKEGYRLLPLEEAP